MSLVIQISKHKKIIIPKGANNQDKFIGLWLKAQQKAITKARDYFLNKDYTEEEFDQKVDEETYDIYKQLEVFFDRELFENPYYADISSKTKANHGGYINHSGEGNSEEWRIKMQNAAGTFTHWPEKTQGLC